MHRARGGVPLASGRTARADHRLSARAIRGALVAAALFAGAAIAAAELSQAEVEDAAEVARRAAGALLTDRRDVFIASLDVDRIAAGSVGRPVWAELSDRQRGRIVAAVRERIAGTLEPPRSAATEVAWSSARASGDDVHVFLGLKYPLGVLKTRWTMVRSSGGWRVADILLSDPGVSVTGEAAQPFASGLLARRDRGSEALAAALPRLLGLAAIVAIVIGLRRRLSPKGRKIVLATAVAPAVLFLVDGALAVRRALSEPWVVPEHAAAPPWRPHEREAVRAQREGRVEDARRAWQRAVAAGAPAAPADYQLGVALAAAGRRDEARVHFLRALAHPRPAPGAEKELALLALRDGDAAAARDRLERYVRTSGPDPDALSALAVARANLEETGAVEAVEEARALSGDRSSDLLLQARVSARAGNAPATVAALRSLEAREGIDREALRADPVYLPIATEPEWVSFLSEKPPAPRTPVP